MIKHITLGISVSLLLLLPVRAQESDSMKEEQQIRFIIKEIAKGWEKGDTDVFQKYYTHDSTARMIENGWKIIHSHYSAGKVHINQQSPQSNDAPAASQPQDHPTGEMQMSDEEEVAHPFFTHMGVPEPVGVFSLRLGGLTTRAEGNTDGDFAFHFETGLTKFVGLHVRNDRFLDKPSTEVMFQFAAVRSENGMSGFSPIIEFEVPTKSGGEQPINTLVGFSTALASSQSAFNQVIH